MSIDDCTEPHRIDFANPLEWINYIWGKEIPHIIYNPLVNPQYRIIRRSTHDGTILFKHELIHQALSLLVYKQSYYKPEVELFESCKDLRYIIGDIQFDTWTEKDTLVQLPCGIVPGEYNLITIPVKIEFEWRDKNDKSLQ